MSQAETIIEDGIEIAIARPASVTGQVQVPDYYVLTSPSLPEGITVAFYRTLVEWCMATHRPDGQWRHRRFKVLDDARQAAIKYVVNQVKKNSKEKAK